MPPPKEKRPQFAATPRAERYRRYWGYYNRPYVGCGFLWTALLIMLIIWLLVWLLPGIGIRSVY